MGDYVEMQANANTPDIQEDFPRDSGISKNVTLMSLSDLNQEEKDLIALFRNDEQVRQLITSYLQLP